MLPRRRTHFQEKSASTVSILPPTYVSGQGFSLAGPLLVDGVALC